MLIRYHLQSRFYYMNRSPNIAFFGGTVIIAIMVMAAFANLANA
jgi:hypothetical protein